MDERRPERPPTSRPPGSGVPRLPPGLPLLLLFAVGLLAWWAADQSTAGRQLRYDEFKQLVREGHVESVTLGDQEIRGELTADAPQARQADETGRRFRTVRVSDESLVALLDEHGVKYTGAFETRGAPWLLYLGLGLFLLFMLSRSAMSASGGGPAGVLSFGKSRGRLYQEDDVSVTFADVAGIPEAKGELQEIIDFLRHPERYATLGATIPKGVLLIGPPGTGKTLLARAVAGEAKVPFISINGSEFVEMFVGVGASRVRDLFEQASKAAPCIVFIDELDAIGRSRGGVQVGGGGNDEREQTLNQLLVELDGFAPHKAVIIMSATNRPEVLDPALLRPGRFDRQVLVDRPDRTGRRKILAVHARKVPLDPELDLDDVAGQTAGFAGADLKNLVNEAALAAARRKADKVSAKDFSQAIDRVVAGLQRKSQLISDSERERIAYHESGHAIASVGNTNERVQKISIIPHGMSALGYTRKVPEQDRKLMTESELRSTLVGLLGGRCAEVLVFGEPSTGAANDLLRATELARSMVLEYGMSERLGPLGLRGAPNFIGGPLGGAMPDNRMGDEMLDVIDAETGAVMRRAEQEALAMLRQNRDLLDRMATRLLSEEQLEGEELSSFMSEVRLPGPARLGQDGERDAKH